MSTGRGDYTDMEHVENAIYKAGADIEERIDACQEDMAERLEKVIERLGDRLTEAFLLGQTDFRKMPADQRVKFAEALLAGTSSKVAPR